MAYHQFTLAREVTLLYTDEGVVVLALAQCGAMDICSKEADSGKHSFIERSLDHKSDGIALNADDSTHAKSLPVSMSVFQRYNSSTLLCISPDVHQGTFL